MSLAEHRLERVRSLAVLSGAAVLATTVSPRNVGRARAWVLALAARPREHLNSADLSFEAE
jgi:hypothetical protein